jgi:hypothetical protein
MTGSFPGLEIALLLPPLLLIWCRRRARQDRAPSALPSVGGTGNEPTGGKANATFS